jgi:hypothetical protein
MHVNFNAGKISVLPVLSPTFAAEMLIISVVSFNQSPTSYFNINHNGFNRSVTHLLLFCCVFFGQPSRFICKFAGLSRREFMCNSIYMS